MDELKPCQYSDINPLRWSPKMIEKRTKWKCQAHRHNGLTTGHQNCYNKTHEIIERKAFIDIETSNLKANFGVILTWCIKAIGDTGLTYDYITHDDIETGTADKRIVQTLVNTIWMYDRLVGQYSTYFDIPWIRTRALHWDIPFPEYGMLWHSDTWRMAKNKLCLHSNRQDSIAQAVQHKSLKTRLNPDTWSKVLFGSKKQRTTLIKEVLKHNEMDVYEGEGNYLKLLPFVREMRTSI